jgi:hypothetical protein
MKQRRETTKNTKYTNREFSCFSCGSWFQKFFSEPDKQRNLSYLALAVYLLAQFGRGVNSTLQINDHLEIITPVFSTLSLSQLFGSGDAIVPNIMGGVPLWALLGAGPLNLLADAHVLFGGFFGIVVFESVVRLLALWSMQKLLSRHAGVKDPVVAWGVALCFSILPINYSVLSIVLLPPLAALSFLELLGGGRLWWAAGLAAYPLFCPLPLGFPIFFLLGILTLYKCLKNRALILRALCILAPFAALYAAVEYRILFQVFFHSGFVSHRTDRVWPVFDLMNCLHDIPRLLLTGEGEIYTSGYILPVIVLTITWVLCAPKRFLNSFPKILWAFFAFHVLMAVLFALWFTPVIQPILIWLGLDDLYLCRFVYLWNVLLYTAWALALAALPPKKYYRRILLIIQFVYLCSVSQAAYILHDPHVMSYDQFFSPRLFAKIRDAIGEPQSSYRVVSLGMPANVPLYSGFYTLDGYLNNYPLEFKRRFRAVIAPDLDQEGLVPAMMRGKFDWNGNFLYIFTQELGWYQLGERYITRGEAQYRLRSANPIHMESDLSGFYPLGARYLLSAVEIADAWKNGLTLLGVFTDNNSPYIIRLYRIHKPVGPS